MLVTIFRNCIEDGMSFTEFKAEELESVNLEDYLDEGEPEEEICFDGIPDKYLAKWFLTMKLKSLQSEKTFKNILEVPNEDYDSTVVVIGYDRQDVKNTFYKFYLVRK